MEIGKQSALQAEKQLPMLSDAAVSRYVSAIGARLAAQAPGPKFVYQFKVVNVSEVNAFALPGGFIYVNRGLLSKARTEGELAGVMAHEIAHVALRHPTNQASKAYLAQAGLGVLGGLLGGKTQSSTGQIIEAVGGFGLNSLFLKFSRSVGEPGRCRRLTDPGASRIQPDRDGDFLRLPGPAGGRESQQVRNLHE